METLSPQKKPFIPSISKRTYVITALLIALPVIIAGALTPQNIRQDAAGTTKKPNIILITVDTQRADSMHTLPVITSRLRSRAMTITNAVGTPIDMSGLEKQFSQEGYTVKNLVGNPADTVIGEGVQTFLRTTAEPYYLSVRLTSPQTVGEEENCGIAIRRSPAVNEEDVRDKPAAIRTRPELTEQSLRVLEAEKSRKACALRSVDTLVGNILDTLGTTENTVILYTALRGEAFGEQRVSGTECAYTVCHHVPFILYYPRLLTTGLMSDALVSLTDIPATIAELTGTQVVSAGSVSLVPLLTRPDASIRTTVPISSAEGVRSLRTKEFLYTIYPNGEEELYDLEADPFQLKNQRTNPDYQSELNEMREIIRLQGE